MERLVEVDVVWPAQHHGQRLLRQNDGTAPRRDVFVIFISSLCFCTYIWAIIQNESNCIFFARSCLLDTHYVPLRLPYIHFAAFSPALWLNVPPPKQCHQSLRWHDNLAFLFGNSMGILSQTRQSWETRRGNGLFIDGWQNHVQVGFYYFFFLWTQ